MPGITNATRLRIFSHPHDLVIRITTRPDGLGLEFAWSARQGGALIWRSYSAEPHATQKQMADIVWLTLNAWRMHSVHEIRQTPDMQQAIAEGIRDEECVLKDGPTDIFSLAFIDRVRADLARDGEVDTSTYV